MAPTEFQQQAGYGACSFLIALISAAIAIATVGPAAAIMAPDPSSAPKGLFGGPSNAVTIVAQAPNPSLPAAAAPSPSPEVPADQTPPPGDSAVPDPFGATGGGGAPPPACTPVVPSTVELIDDKGSHTAPSNGSFVAQVTAAGHNIHVTINGVQACGGNHVALTITDHGGNFACDVAMSGSISVVIGAFNSPSDTVTITAVHGSGC